MEWIKWICSIVGAIIGTGVVGEVVMYFIKRHDEIIKKDKSIIEKVISELSQYSECLNSAYIIWDSNISNLLDEIRDYIEKIHEAGDNLKFLKSEYKDVVDEEQKHICKYAKICPRCINSAPPDTLLEYSKRSNIVLAEFTEKQNKLKEVILRLLDEIQSEISEFNDLTNHFPDVYTLNDKKRREKIIFQLEKIQIVNAAIIGCLIDIKSDPIGRICDGKYSIARLLLDALSVVAKGKIEISQIMD